MSLVSPVSLASPRLNLMPSAAAKSFEAQLRPVRPNDRFTRVRVLSDVCIHENLSTMSHMISGFKQVSQDAERQGMDVLRFNQGDTNLGAERNEFELSMLLNGLLKLHAGTLGNHEMDLAATDFAAGLQKANYPFLVSNLTYPQSPGQPNVWQQLTQQGKLRTQAMVIDGQQGRYGVIGVTTPELLNFVDKSLDRQGVGTLDVEQTRLAIRQAVDSLQQQGINKIILLSHLGYKLDQQIAESVSGLDLILGGHSHDVTPGVVLGKNLLMSPNDEPVLIVESGKNGKYLDAVDVTFDPQGRIVNVDHHLAPSHQFAPDPQAQALISQTLGPQTPVATIANSYNSANNAFTTDPVAELVADATRELTNADIAFVRSSQIRRDIEPGELTPLDIKEIFPFGGKLLTATLTGEAIRKSLERSAAAIAKHDPHPGLLHPSGLSMVIDKTAGTLKEAWTFNRASQAWEPLNPFKTYTVAYDDFIVANQTELPELANPVAILQKTEIPYRKLFTLALKLVGADQAPLTLKSDDRIKIL
jgi:2',3'-cyclic-nucleotide 2'-phosphodiesterase (5'-nucleotidase family)